MDAVHFTQGPLTAIKRLHPSSHPRHTNKNNNNIFQQQFRSKPLIMSHFIITSHVVRTQHTRGRPAGAERGRENDLRLHVNQYVPNDNPNPKPGDVTIIGAQANGFPEECYEPFWDDLYENLRAQGRAIRGIWIADIASQGQSGVLNESILGPDGKNFSLAFPSPFSESTTRVKRWVG
jgi:hypothetical protein